MKFLPSSKHRPLSDTRPVRPDSRYSRTFRWLCEDTVTIDADCLVRGVDQLDLSNKEQVSRMDENISFESRMDVPPLNSLQLEALKDDDDSLSTVTSEGSTVLPRNSPKPFEYLHFSPHSLDYVTKTVSPSKADRYMKIGWKMNMGFKMVKSDTRLIKTLLHSYGFTQCSARNPSFNLLWTSAHLKAHVLRNLQPWQRVNHFPRSVELTRKDKLYENIARSKAQYGLPFDFIPEFYVTPRDIDRLSCAMMASSNKNSNSSYIVKPVSMSRGRGIFFANKPDDIPLASNLLVSQYIHNPSLVNGHKFDLRLYVAVTSFYPLICYVYSEGLTRLASEKYSSCTPPEDEFVHLTNYSVNKNSKTFVRNDTFSSEDFGHKWTLGALLRHLQKEGKDMKLLMVRIEDLIIKSLLSVQSSIASVCRTTLSSPNTCFELFGFDVLVDDNLKPWLLEVNLSPSLTCDAPLDSVVKTRLVCDLFNLACIPLVDRKIMRGGSGGGAGDSESDSPPSSYVSPRAIPSKMRRPLTVRRSLLSSPSRNTSSSSIETRSRQLNWKLRVESGRKGGFVRVFPRKNTMDVYGPIMDHCGVEKWDGRLYAEEYGERNSMEEEETSDNEDEERVKEKRERAHRIHQELMDCEKFPNESSLSSEVHSLVLPFLSETTAYLKKITKEGEKIMAKLPSVRASARLRTKSCNDFYEMRAAKMYEEMNDMINKRGDGDSCISSFGKENTVPPLHSSLSSSHLISGLSNGNEKQLVQNMSDAV